MKMSWGKFKGHEIELLPSAYLKWLAENCDEESPRNKQVCIKADTEWHYRERYNCHVE